MPAARGSTQTAPLPGGPQGHMTGRQEPHPDTERSGQDVAVGGQGPEDNHARGERPVASVITSQRRWDALLERVKGGEPGLLQSGRWGEFKGASGWSPVRLAVAESLEAAGNGPALAGQVLFRSVPRLPIPLSVAYIPRGPVGLHVGAPAQTGYERAERAFWSRVHAEARRRGAVFLKVEPQLELGELATAEEVDRAMEAHGFRPSGRLQPARTIVLDIDRSDDQLLKAMKPKTRYNLRLAEKRGVVVRRGADLGDLRAFYSLLQVTGSRDEFGIHLFPYYEQMWRVFGPEGNNSALLLLAEHPDEAERAAGPIAGLLVLAFGREAIYMYGASDNRGREHMPNYLLQWRAIQWARERGCRVYDFWGIPDPPSDDEEAEGVSPTNTRSGLRGVYWFKKGFGGREVSYPGAYDYVYNPLLYKLWMRWRGADLG